MIGNLAHDLKTPLQSFMVGLDMIEQVVRDIDKLHAACQQTVVPETIPITAQNCLDRLGGFIDTLHQSCRDAQSTHSFMLMTINRCIDFTKTSKGLRLSPKYETFDLQEAIGMILNCMRNIQDRISIEMLPMSEEICSHIITDKQWLQENVLCLLSNAVKYSSSGEVRIQVLLVEDSVLETGSVATIEEAFEDALTDSKSPTKELGWQRPMQMFMISNEPRIYPDIPIKSRTFYSTVASTYSRVAGIKNKQSILRLRFEIEDNGIGLSEEAMKSLFNPFQQAQRLAGGTGKCIVYELCFFD